MESDDRDNETVAHVSSGENLCLHQLSLSLFLLFFLPVSRGGPEKVLESIQSAFSHSLGEDCRATECRPPVAIDGGVKSGASLNAS